MDSQASRLALSSPSSSAKPSALPTRISRLPLPKPSSPVSTTSSNLASKKQASAASVRASPAPNGAVRSRTRTALSTAPVSNPSRKGPNPKTTPDAGSRKPREVLPLRQTQPPKPRQACTSGAKSNGEDGLGDLDGFRSASRASSRQVPRDDEPEAPDNGDPNTPVARKARPSLSERTIESLAQLPPTPGSRRRSSFFSPESPRAPSSRPTSSTGARRGPFASSVHATSTRPLSPSKPASVFRSSTTANATSTRTTAAAGLPRAQSPTKASMMKSVDKAPPQTLSAKRTSRLPPKGGKTVSGKISVKRPESASGAGSSKTPSKARPSIAKTGSSKPSPNPSKSSAALREQIRRAKAERRSLSAKQEPATTDPELDFDISQHDDPFNQQPKNHVMRRRVDAARSDGRLNISAMELKQIPEEVLKMYDYDFNKDNDVAWGELVDLTRFIAADNELETIQDEVFPDVGPDGLAQDDDRKGPQFGGIEVLDLHGNLLSDIPAGLRRLQNLTVLNLSRNRLTNNSLDTITQISSLRELRMAENALSGKLSSSIQQLTNLEVLELQGNKLSSLPEEIRALANLRILSLSGNHLATLPTASLACTSLVELTASKNHLFGTLFAPSTPSLSRLRILDVSVNRLDTLHPADAAAPSLPELRTLNIAFNNITGLPPLSSTPNLTELLAEDNKISSLPSGFTDSETLRVADFTGNDFSRLDEKIALMDSLESFRVDANPLREKKFLTMKTAELMADLRRRLEAPGHVA